VDIVVDTPASDFIGQHFPRAQEYLKDNFRLLRTIGPFVIYERQAAESHP
jgi:hypothetical protein